MRTTQLLTTAAAALVLGAGVAMAGDVSGPVKPERAPAAQQKAPAEKVAPNMHAGDRKPAETTGQASPQTVKPGTGGSAKPDQHGTVGAAPKSDEDKNAAGKNGMKADERGQAKSDTKARDNGKAESNGTAQKSPSGNDQTKGASQDSAGPAGKSAAGANNATTGQGAAGSFAKLSTQQRSKITTVIKQQKVQPTQLNISVRVGVHVPASVHYYPLPAEVVEIYPEWRGYDFILVGDQIVIIDPHSRAVVFIIEA